MHWNTFEKKLLLAEHYHLHYLRAFHDEKPREHMSIQQVDKIFFSGMVQI
jgi:hypothetical protein